MDSFTHFDGEGNARMVDVGGKTVTDREAVAVGRIYMSADCFSRLTAGTLKKGDVLTVAQVAGIMGAKETSRLIPLCHIVPLTHCAVTFRLLTAEQAIEACCRTRCEGRTGVEMEALTGVSTALLAIYDMCKAVDRRMHIEGIHLVEKAGGRSGHFYYDEAQGHA